MEKRNVTITAAQAKERYHVTEVCAILAGRRSSVMIDAASQTYRLCAEDDHSVFEITDIECSDTSVTIMDLPSGEWIRLDKNPHLIRLAVTGVVGTDSLNPGREPWVVQTVGARIMPYSVWRMLHPWDMRELVRRSRPLDAIVRSVPDHHGSSRMVLTLTAVFEDGTVLEGVPVERPARFALRADLPGIQPSLEQTIGILDVAMRSAIHGRSDFDDYLIDPAGLTIAQEGPLVWRFDIDEELVYCSGMILGTRIFRRSDDAGEVIRDLNRALVPCSGGTYYSPPVVDTRRS